VLTGGNRRRIGDRVVRRPRQAEMAPRRIRTAKRRRALLSPAASALLSLSGGFAALIAIGTALLWLPISATGPGHADFVTALFTATSAVCVTGLVVVSSADYWTTVGQVVLLVLMFMGGLGIMTAGLVILTAIGRRVTLNQRLIVRDTMGGASLGGVMTLGRYVIIFATAVQAVGFLALFAKLSFEFPVGEAAWNALFHSVSAFNNAGFAIFKDSESLSRFETDPLMLSMIAVLIILGGLSFPVVAELARRKRPNRCSLDTKLVIIGTISLWVVGGLSMFLFEFGNPQTLGAVPLQDQITNATFQAVTARTAGFATIDFSATRPGNDFLFMFLMFVGGASGSTAGGIKVNTAMILLVAGMASINGRPRTEVFGRELPVAQVTRALALFLLAVLALFLVVVALAITEVHNVEAGRFGFLDLLFEATSAVGTTGLSRGITADLTEPGKVVLAIGMYLGRLGPLTIALGLALKERRAVYRFAEERVRLG
jgi:trk system potassium uptake protein